MSARLDPASVVHGAGSISDKIRALDRAGYSRSQIAAFLGKRYQHVRNVLVDDQRRAASADGGVAETKAPFQQHAAPDAIFHLEVQRDGSVRLPTAMMAALDVNQGGNIVASVDGDGSVTLLSARQSLQRARYLLKIFVPPGVSLVDELLADRRAEVENERPNR